MKNRAEQREMEIIIEFKTEDLDESLNKSKSGILRKGVKFKNEDFKKIEDPKRYRYAYKTCETEAPRKAGFKKHGRRVLGENERTCNQRGNYVPSEDEPKIHAQHAPEDYGMKCDKCDEKFTPRDC